MSNIKLMCFDILSRQESIKKTIMEPLSSNHGLDSTRTDESHHLKNQYLASVVVFGESNVEKEYINTNEFHNIKEKNFLDR